MRRRGPAYVGGKRFVTSTKKNFTVYPFIYLYHRRGRLFYQKQLFIYDDLHCDCHPFRDARAEG